MVGVTADHVATLNAFVKENKTQHMLLSDFRRQMLPAWGAIVTDEKSPIYRYAKRAYFILDKNGTVKFTKVMDNPLDLLDANEVLRQIRESGAAS